MKTFLVFLNTLLIIFNLQGQNVGINTTMPGADLHVNGDVKITDGTQGSGKVLTSDGAGLASWQSPKVFFTLGSDQSIASNNFVGLGSSSSSFVRNSIVIPFNGVITSLIFSVRQQSNTTVTCEIFRAPNGLNPVSTGIIATVPIGSSYAIVNGNVVANQGDLISVRISSSLVDGIAATIVYQ